MFSRQRVNYPMKDALRDLEEYICFEMSNDLQRFCVSWASKQVAYSGILQLLESWNAHCSSGKDGGISNVLAARTACLATCTEQVPSLKHNIERFGASGGYLARASTF